MTSDFLGKLIMEDCSYDQSHWGTGVFVLAQVETMRCMFPLAEMLVRPVWSNIPITPEGRIIY